MQATYQIGNTGEAIADILLFDLVPEHNALSTSRYLALQNRSGPESVVQIENKDDVIQVSY